MVVVCPLSAATQATRWGRVIISEFTVPADRKTIKPVNAGGVAGGAKYVPPIESALCLLCGTFICSGICW